MTSRKEQGAQVFGLQGLGRTCWREGVVINLDEKESVCGQVTRSGLDKFYLQCGLGAQGVMVERAGTEALSLEPRGEGWGELEMWASFVFRGGDSKCKA